jgi:hypothetical protein
VVSASPPGWATGRRSIDQARQDALGLCVASAKCRIVNVNNKPMP